MPGVKREAMRMAALDVGDARIGVAVSDEMGLTTRGIGVVARRGGVYDLDAIGRLLAPFQPGRVVVGLPLNMDGSEGPQARKVRTFGERLADHLALAVEFWDERLTTVEAEDVMRETAVPRRKRRAQVDQVAAAVILRSYLSAHT
jgi:putative pre-16S rRNA nuclease